MKISGEVEQETAMEPNIAEPGKCPACNGQPANLLQARHRFHGRTHIYQLVRCFSCSLVWLQDPPRPEEMGNHYGEDYDRAIAGAD